MTARTDLQRAQLRRAGVDPDIDERLDRAITLGLAEVGKPGTNFKQVGPDARKKLKGLMAYYAKKPHPFAACVRDNTKRFGPDRAKRVCAVLKDLIRGTTKWRKGGDADRGAKGLALSEDVFVLDDETAELLDALPEETLYEMLAILDEDAS